MRCIGFFAALISCAADAVYTNIGDLSYLQAQHSVRLRVGPVGAGIQTVTFAVPGPKVGSGESVSQSAASVLDPQYVVVEVQARTPNFGDRKVTLTATTPAGLCHADGCSVGVIPMSEISWSALSVATGAADGNISAGGIADGSFRDASTMVLATFPSGQRLLDQLFFSYANTTLYPAGIYAGRVVFTASMP